MQIAQNLINFKRQYFPCFHFHFLNYFSPQGLAVFFLEYTGELRIISLRRRKENIEVQKHKHPHEPSAPNTAYTQTHSTFNKLQMCQIKQGHTTTTQHLSAVIRYLYHIIFRKGKSKKLNFLVCNKLSIILALVSDIQKQISQLVCTFHF